MLYEVITKLINHTDFGKTDKFLIAQEDEQLVEKEVAYLNEKYKYAQILFLTTLEIDDNKNIDYTFINSLDELKSFLKKVKFNAVYFIGATYKEIYDEISKESLEPTLL